MQINLHIEQANNVKKTVVAKPADFIAFEKTYNLSIQSLERLEHMAWLAWYVEKRTKATDLDFDTWVETLEDVRAEETKKSKG